MPEEISPREFGALQTEVANLKEQVKDLSIAVRSLTAALDNAKGGWKTLAALGGISAAFGALLIKLTALLH